MAPEFQYSAVDSFGKKVSGNLQAIDTGSLEAKLMETGYWLLDFKERKTSAMKGGGQKVSRRDLIEFCVQVEALTAAGVPLLDALKTISADTPNQNMRLVVEDLARNVESGYSLHEVMKNHPKAIPELMVNMVMAGEQSGALPEAFQQLRDYLEWYDRLMKDIQQATVYPSMVMVALSVFMTLLYTVVVPEFVKILVGLNIPLPLPTKIVVWTSGFFVSYWWMLLVIPAIWFIVVKIGKKRSEKFAYNFDRMKLKIPAFGELIRLFAISRFSKNFCTLFNAGMPIIQNLELCRKQVRNKVMEKALEDASAGVVEGSLMSESLAEHKIFPPMALRMVMVGESTGDLGSAMQRVSDYLNDEIPRRIKKLFGIIEPAILVMLIVVVGVTALALFLPILSLVGNVH